MPAPDPSPQPGDQTPVAGEPPQGEAPEADDATPVRGVPTVPAPVALPAPATWPQAPASGQPSAYPQPVTPGQPGGYPAPVQIGRPAAGQPFPPAPGHPVGAQPIGAVPFGTPPVGTQPVGAVPLGTPPVGAAPTGAAPTQPAWPAAGLPAPAVPPPPATPTIPVPFAALLAAAARRAGAGYLAALVLAFVQTVLLIGFTDDLPLGVAVTLPVLLVSMSLFGTASVGYAESAMVVDSAFDASLRLTPLTLLLALVVGVVVVAALERRAGRLPAAEGTLPRDRWITAGLTGGVLTIGASILAAVLTVSVEGVTLVAFGFRLVLGALVVGALASVLGDLLDRRGTPHPERFGLRVRPLGEVRAALAAAATLLGLPAVVLLVVGVAWVAVESTQSLLGVPALVLNVLVWAVAMVMGGGITVAGGTSYGGSSAEVQTLFGSGLPLWATLLLLLLALLATQASGVVLAVRRPGAPWSRAWITPLVLAVVGGVLTLLSGVVLSGGISLGVLGGSASGWVGIAPWWFLSLAVWAVGVEAVARYVAPLLIGLLPVARQQALHRRATPATAPLATSAPAPALLSPTARPWLLVGGIGVGALVVLGVGGAIALDQVNQRVFGPEAVAEEYLAALEAGEASTAIALGSPDTLGMDEALLTDEVYAAATDRPTDPRVIAVERSGDTAYLTVEFQQGGATVTDTLVARRTGSTAVLFDAWELRGNAIGTISLSGTSSVESLTVNGVDVALSDGWMMAALPGTYTLAGAESRWLDFTESTVTVRGSGWADAEPPAATPSAALTAETDRLVSEYLAACIASTETEPADCPNESWVYDELSGIIWTLDAAPVVELDLDHSWEEGEYVLDTVTPGSATLTGAYAEETWSHAIGEPYSETVEIAMYGTIVVDGDDVRFEYSRY